MTFNFSTFKSFVHCHLLGLPYRVGIRPPLVDGRSANKATGLACKFAVWHIDYEQPTDP